MSHSDHDTESMRRLLRRDAGLLAICKELLGNAPSEEKISNVITHVKTALDLQEDASVWIELDDGAFGEIPGPDCTASMSAEIFADGHSRGRLNVRHSDIIDYDPVDEEFLREAAGFIGGQVELQDREETLKQSQERFKKLAGNLAKEM